jgi:hypothetical protein
MKELSSWTLGSVSAQSILVERIY